MRVAINGVGIAGPTLAYWLRESGHDVLLVEESPQLRSGGYAIDFWGVGYDIAEKMGLLPRIMEHGYQVKEVRFVDREGRKDGGFDVDVIRRLTHGRYTTLRRSDLSSIIYSALAGVETIFGDSIAWVEERQTCASIGFVHAPPREVDLIVGADGLHSRVRQVVFGQEKEFEISLGYHVAAFEIEGYRPRNDLVYVSHSMPGRQISRFPLRGDRTLFLFVFRDEYLGDQRLTNDTERKSALERIFADAEWEAPQILAAMKQVGNIYFDRVSQIRMDHWCRGRTALVGDAAAGVSLLAGEGTGLAMAEAYVLAGELQECGADYGTAFARYQKRMMPFLRHKQQTAADFASSFAPKTALGITVRNVATGVLRIPAVADFLLGRSLRDDLDLPEYRFHR